MSQKGFTEGFLPYLVTACNMDYGKSLGWQGDVVSTGGVDVGFFFLQKKGREGCITSR